MQLNGKTLTAFIFSVFMLTGIFLLTCADVSAQNTKLTKQAKITMEQAREIALKRVNGTITDQELEKKRGKIIYSFDIKDANGKVFDVEIDAKTGKVLKVEEDKEDEEKDDN